MGERKKLSALQYLQTELYPANRKGFMDEWKGLNDEDKTWLKNAANEEMEALER